MNGTLVWFDIETTGLDPVKDLQLQVGIKAGDRKLQFEFLWDCQDLAIARARAEPVVQEMHDRTGLWEACKDTGKLVIPVYRRDEELVQFVKDLPRPLILAGNSIHFDRRWVIEWLPKFNAELHYRMLDVSALNIAGELFGFPKRSRPTEPAHTALADIEDSIANLEYWRQWFRTGLPLSMQFAEQEAARGGAE